MIDVPLNTSIRLALRGFKSSPIESLRNIAYEPPPNIRRTLNSILYAVRTIKNKNNLANKYVDTIIQEAENLQINIKEIVPREPQTIPPWLMQINTNTEVTENKKNNTNPNTYKNLFHDTIQKYHDRKHIYTDASKTTDSVGIAIVAENITITYKLPTEYSIYTAEALSIYNAVLYILHNKETTPNNYLIISDSLSSITGIQNTTNPSDISKLI
jgi:hypothetical protein